MKNTIKLALVAAMAMGATSAFATNGDNLIGLGAKSRAMGGTGIAAGFGAESALANPALITSVKGTEVSFAGTLFMPSVEAANQGSTTFAKSDADKNMIPEVAVASSLGDGLYLGAGIFGSAGMGVDYRSAAPASAMTGMASNLMMMKFAVPVAYKIDGLSIGIAPVLQYGALDMAYDSDANGALEGNGVSQDFGFGYEIGAAYDLSADGVDGLTLGVTYKSAINMTYDYQLGRAMEAFTATMPGGPYSMADNLEQPAEIGIGVAFELEDILVTADYKKIKWGDAKGYKDFGWEDQNVIALGAAYTMNDLTLRAGFNHATSPISGNPVTALAGPPAASDVPNMMGGLMNTLNYALFPATVETHYSAGLGYQFSKTVSADFAVTYAPEETTSADVHTALGAVTTIQTKHSQLGLTAGVNFNF